MTLTRTVVLALLLSSAYADMASAESGVTRVDGPTGPTVLTEPVTQAPLPGIAPASAPLPGVPQAPAPVVIHETVTVQPPPPGTSVNVQQQAWVHVERDAYGTQRVTASVGQWIQTTPTPTPMPMVVWYPTILPRPSERTPRDGSKGLLAGGGVLFGMSYGLTLVVEAAQASGSGVSGGQVGLALIPALGPVMAAFYTTSHDSGATSGYLIDATVQILGLALIVAGVGSEGHHAPHGRATGTASASVRPLEWGLAPYAGAGAGGATFAMRF